MHHNRIPHRPGGGSAIEEPLPKAPRVMKSLQMIAAGFVELLQQSNDGVVDIKDAAKFLDADQKRRIYDITNVLEGVGLIMKISKRKVKWIGAQPGQERFARRVLELKCEMDDLEQREFMLDQQRRWVEQSIEDTRDNCSHLTYVNHEDICSCFRGHTLLAVKAPSGIHLDVPIPKASLNSPVLYQIHMKSTSGPIDILLVSTNPATSDPVTLPVPPPEDVLRSARLATCTSSESGSDDAPADTVHLRQTGTQDAQHPHAASFLKARTSRMDSPLLQNLTKELRKLLDPNTEITKADILTKLFSSEVFPKLRHEYSAPQCDSDGNVDDGEGRRDHFNVPVLNM